MKQNNKSTAFTGLLKAGMEEAKKVQEIKSVAGTAEIIEASASEEVAVQEENLPVSLKDSETSKETAKRGIEFIFADRKINMTEAVRIPSEFHKELKILAGLSGCTIVQMLGNILDNFLDEKKKDISSYKKKMI